MKFCTGCGAQLVDNARFCVKCGTQCHMEKLDDADIQDVKNVCNSAKPKKQITKKVSIVAIAIALVAVMVAYHFLLGSGRKRAEFNIEYSAEGVNSFLEIVCRNVDGDYAKVLNPNYNSPAGNSCYSALLEVKLDGKVAQEVPVRFYNKYSSDKVNKAIVTIGNSGWYTTLDEAEDKFDCYIECMEAIEFTICGKTYIKEYLDSYYSVLKYIQSADNYNKEKLITEYWLTEDTKVELSCLQSGYVYFSVIKH